MEIRETVDPTRSGHPWHQTPIYVPPVTYPTGSSSFLPYTDTAAAYYPFYFPQYAYQGLGTYGITTAALHARETHEPQSQLHKRRRLNAESPLVSENFQTPSAAASWCSPQCVKMEHDSASSDAGGGGGTHMALEDTGSSSLTRKMAGLTAFLCPCCGYGLNSNDGYRPISQVSPLAYGPEKPYTMEQPLTMPTTSCQSHKQSAVRDANRHPHPLGGVQSDVQSTSFAEGVAQGTVLSSPLSEVDRLSGDENWSVARVPHHAAPYLNSKQHKLTDSPYVETKVEPKDSFCSLSHSAAALGPSLLYTAGAPIDTETPSPYTVVATGGLGRDEYAGLAAGVSPHGSTSNFDILQPNQRGGKRGPFKDHTLREQTAQTRKLGSCIRCRMQRIRCEHNDEEPGGPCLTCKKVTNTKAGRLPCLRYKITDVRLYKPGQVPGYEWTRRWSDNISDPVQKWRSEETKTIYLSEGYSERCLQLKVREFEPQEGDKLQRSWFYGGRQKSVQIPPYALVNLEDGRAAYMKHIRESMGETLTSIVGRPGDPSFKTLLHKTYFQMLGILKDLSAPMDSRIMLKETFELWMSVRFTTKSVFIVGDETLGMARDILDDTSPTPGKIPLPPVLGAQLDLVLIHHIQRQLRRMVLERLERMISKRKHNTWMITYLVTFALLHNTALITAHDASYARKHGMKRRFAREEKVREYHLGANILLAHFHYCNKGVHPFSENCKDQDLRNLAGLNEDQIRFIHATRGLVNRNKKEWEEMRAKGDYENEYYFVSQLFEEGWQPRPTI